MLNHISIAVNEPKRVAGILAELWGGMVIPFPPAPGSYIVLANDGKGSGVEVTPAGTVLVPGEGLPPEDDLNAATAEYEAKFVKSEFVPQYVATHLNISTELSIDEIKAIGKREGGRFQLVELWIEDNFMLEVMTPAQTARYREITSPAFITKFFGGDIPTAGMPQHPAPQNNLSLIG